MELWERSGQLELLGDLLRATAHGGRVAVVAGEAGIGTRGRPGRRPGER